MSVSKPSQHVTKTVAVISGDWSRGTGLIPGRDILGPLALMVTTPCFSIIFFHVCTYMNGNFLQFAAECYQYGVVTMLQAIWPNPWDASVWRMIGSFMGFELFLMKAVPGKRMYGSVTPKGHVPEYTANGTACYAITLLTLLVLAFTGQFDPAVVYDKFGNILASLNVFAWAFCTMLLIKGHVAPSTSDSGTTGNWVQDFFWGMELYPSIAGWNLKMFTNCRFGMMFWAVAIVCFAYKNMQLQPSGQLQYGMAVSVCLQLIYISKFFHWEMGYMRSMDIQHDRAGYYICWGCLVWVPAVYTSAAFYLTKHAPDQSAGTALAIFAAGWFCIWVNYESDHQRYSFRQSGGKCLIWGKVPHKIVATYTTTIKTESGKEETVTKQSLLLLDGWWKYSRHFHYMPEVLASFFWACSAWNTGLVGPYFYVVYLTILLTDRAYRDDDRCRKKYGAHWEEYCRQVPYKIVPGVV